MGFTGHKLLLARELSHLAPTGFEEEPGRIPDPLWGPQAACPSRIRGMPGKSTADGALGDWMSMPCPSENERKRCRE